MATFPVYVVDAFTDTPFRGNPAAVVPLESPLDDATYALIAREMNHSETAFLIPRPSTERNVAAFALRWFTPTTEIPLCGHATLASAAVLWDERGVQAPRIVFHTMSGELIAEREGTAIRLDFPFNACAPVELPKGVAAALGLSGKVAAEYSASTKKLLVRLSDEKAVRAIAPDFGALKAAKAAMEIRGVIVTAPGTGTTDFVSRYFVPWVGIDEDPVTGSAHTVLVGYWERELGKTEFTAEQVSVRGGKLTVRRRGDRVDLVGRSVVTLRGTIEVGGTTSSRSRPVVHSSPR